MDFDGTTSFVICGYLTGQAQRGRMPAVSALSGP